MQALETVNRELAYLSVMDGLTKVNNRRYFDEALTKEILRAERSRHAIALILVDIDHFKRFNDSYGHLVGDDCLRAVAGTLRDFSLRSSDVLARYGGEEFAIILPDTNEADAYIIAEKIRIAIANIEFIHDGERVPVTVSMGVAGMVPTPGFMPNQLIETADSALYRAKDQGRNCSVAAAMLFDGVVRLG
jgi:diguanylate cyclase